MEFNDPMDVLSFYQLDPQPGTLARNAGPERVALRKLRTEANGSAGFMDNKMVMVSVG